MWLNGFNDNVDGYPKVKCDMIKCPPPYMGLNQPGAPPDSRLGKQGPFGTGDSTPEYGMCPIDKSFPDNDDVNYPIFNYIYIFINLLLLIGFEKTWLC